MKLNFFDYIFITAFLCSILVTTNTLYHISNPYIYEMNPIVVMILEYGVFGMIIAFILAWLFLFGVYWVLRNDKEKSSILISRYISLFSFFVIVFVLVKDLGVVSAI